MNQDKPITRKDGMLPDHFFQHIPHDPDGVEIKIGDRVQWTRAGALLGPDAPRSGCGVFRLHWWGVCEAWDIQDDVHGQITLHPDLDDTMTRETT